MQEESVIIIGAGFAGLAAGIYAQMNGYKTRIFEMHDKPGGLCTAWKRKGYTIDGCVHWLVGSSPRSEMHRIWEEVGVAQGRDFIYLDEFMRFEGSDDRTLILYSDVDQLEKHLKKFSPVDKRNIRELISGIRLCLKLEPSSENKPFFRRLVALTRMGLTMLIRGRKVRKWMHTSATDFAERFHDPVLKEAFRDMWDPDFSIFFLFFTFAFLHAKNAGYPIGGSLPLSMAMEQRYIDLGGTIDYGKRVEKILVENGQAVGIRVANADRDRPAGIRPAEGSEYRAAGIRPGDGDEYQTEKQAETIAEYTADYVISAADGHTTIFDMLGGTYLDQTIRERYDTWPLFSPLVYVGVGVNRSFDDVPKTIYGISFSLKEPTEIADAVRERILVHLFNHDRTLAPEGKSTLVVTISSSYEYWRVLFQDEAVYEDKKRQIGNIIVESLDQRFPGISDDVEVVDVATPLTFQRYTGNWKGSFEGWLITPENASTAMRGLPQTLPGLRNFLMCGQWVEPGGGLPTAVMSGRRLVQSLCKQGGKRFKTVVSA